MGSIVTILEKINTALGNLERKASVYVVALGTGVLLMALARIYIYPAVEAVNHGQTFVALANEPFNYSLNNPLQNRILTPLIANYVGFYGARFIDFVRYIGIAFLALIYIAARKNDLRPATALAASAIFAFTSPIVFFVHFAGYTDITSYLCIFIAMLTVRTIYVWPVMLALSLLNHEFTLFVFPWFFIYYLLNNKRSVLSVTFGALGIGLSILPWYAWVLYVSTKMNPEYAPSFYGQVDMMQNVRLIAANLYTGCFASFKIAWALPIVATYYHLKHRRFGEIFLYAAILACTLLQLLIAHDTSRLMALAFPLIWLGFITVAKELPPILGTSVLLGLVVANIFVPTYYIGQNQEMQFYSVPATRILDRIGVGTWRH
jgi:hypothetical protein